MNNVETKEIPFYGDQLIGLKDENGVVWLSVKQTCLNIGLSDGQARKQVENIQEEPVLMSNCRQIAIVQMEGKRKVSREQLFIKENVVTLWLAKIKLTKKMKENNPDTYDKLIKYQLEAAEVLHKAFYETDEQKEALHKSLGIEGKIADLEIAVEATTEQLKDQSEKLQKVMDNMTINTIQQGRLLSHAKDRVRFLLGGTHSDKYKEDSRKYFSNLWMNFKETFVCASYKDLNPKYFGKALEFVDGWNYRER